MKGNKSSLVDPSQPQSDRLPYVRRWVNKCLVGTGSYARWYGLLGRGRGRGLGGRRGERGDGAGERRQEWGNASVTAVDLQKLQHSLHGPPKQETKLKRRDLPRIGELGV